MEITELRRAPVLPEAYFDVYEELEGEVRALPLVARPHNLAVVHAALALEILAHSLRAMGEREIHARRQLGLPLGVTAFTIAMHGCHRGLTILLRLIDNAGNPDAFPVDTDGMIQDEAVAALRTVNGLAEHFTLLDDVAIGWRGFEVEGHVIRAPSKSRERFGRSIRVGIRAEAELNEPYLAASIVAADSAQLHQVLSGLAAIIPRGTNFEPTDRILDLAEVGTHRAEEQLSRWFIPPEIMVVDQFSVGEYRAASEAIKAFAGVGQIFDDYRNPREGPRLPVRTRAEWVGFLCTRVPIDAARADAILSFLTHARSDVHGGGRLSPTAAHTPLLDLGDGRLALVPTLAIWHDGQLALRTMWKTRAPADYNAQVSGLNHALSEHAGALFAAKAWPAVVRRQVPGGGDIDAGTGQDGFFIAGECKVFIDDPVRGADDPAVWRELDRNVRVLGDPDVARHVLAPEQLAPEEIVGLVIVPGRAQSPVDFGASYALVGLDDLRDRVAEAAGPRELWNAIKAHELRDVPEVVEVSERIGPWTIESDGVRRDALTRGSDADPVTAER